MKNETHTETEEERSARWARFDALTDTDIDVAIAGDPDWQGIREVEGSKGFLVRPERNEASTELRLDIPTYEWFTRRGLNPHELFTRFVHRYIKTHP